MTDALGRLVTQGELAEHLGVGNHHLKTRNSKTLLTLELLEEVDGGYITPTDLEERLERVLEESGCNKAERLQAEKYERERQAWRRAREEPGAKEVSEVNPTVLIKDYQERTELLKDREEMVRNVPATSADGIIYHRAECDCWLCEEDAPEYIPIVQESVA